MTFSAKKRAVICLLRWKSGSSAPSASASPLALAIRSHCRPVATMPRMCM
jgi:hypothetical protein